MINLHESMGPGWDQTKGLHLLPDTLPAALRGLVLVITPLEVESIMKCLPIGKAVGTDGINNRILSESFWNIHVSSHIHSVF